MGVETKPNHNILLGTSITTSRQLHDGILNHNNYASRTLKIKEPCASKKKGYKLKQQRKLNHMFIKSDYNS